MKALIYAAILSVSCPLMAGGSWGGGTPPVSRIFGYMLSDAESAFDPNLGAAVDQLENFSIPHVRSLSFMEGDDGYILIPIPPEQVDRMLRQIKRKGSAGVIVDTGVVLKFVYRDGYLEDNDNAARVVVKPKLD